MLGWVCEGMSHDSGFGRDLKSIPFYIQFFMVCKYLLNLDRLRLWNVVWSTGSDSRAGEWSPHTVLVNRIRVLQTAVDPATCTPCASLCVSLCVMAFLGHRSAMHRDLRGGARSRVTFNTASVWPRLIIDKSPEVWKQRCRRAKTGILGGGSAAQAKIISSGNVTRVCSAARNSGTDTFGHGDEIQPHTCRSTQWNQRVELAC